MRTDTNKYEATHAKKPRGYGLWFFEVTGTDGNGAYLTETVDVTGNFGEAKRAAIREFRTSCGRIKEIVEVVVLP